MGYELSQNVTKTPEDTARAGRLAAPPGPLTRARPLSGGLEGPGSPRRSPLTEPACAGFGAPGPGRTGGRGAVVERPRPPRPIGRGVAPHAGPACPASASGLVERQAAQLDGRTAGGSAVNDETNGRWTGGAMANGPLVGPLVGPLIGPLVGSANGLVDRRAVQQAQRQRLAGARSPARARASRLCRAWAILGWSAGSRQDLPGHPRVNPAGPLAGSPSGDPPGDPAGVSPGSLPGSSPGDLAGVSPGSLSGYSPGDPAEVSPGLLQAHPRGSSGQSIARAHQRILGDPQHFPRFPRKETADPSAVRSADPSAVGSRSLCCWTGSRTARWTAGRTARWTARPSGRTTAARSAG